MRNLKVESEATLTVVICDLDAMLDGRVSPNEAECRRKALQAAALEAQVIDDGTSGKPAADGVPDEAPCEDPE